MYIKKRLLIKKKLVKLCEVVVFPKQKKGNLLQCSHDWKSASLLVFHLLLLLLLLARWGVPIIRQATVLVDNTKSSLFSCNEITTTTTKKK